MGDGLTIAGGTLQIIGLGFVFAELAVIRSHEFAIPTPWARAIGWVRARLGRPNVVQGGAAVSAEFAMKARATVRPGPAPADANVSDRLERLERYVERVDEDIDGLHKALDKQADELLIEAQRRDQEVRQEIEQRDEQRRAALRPSLIRQAIGGTCVFVGLVLATLGGVL